MKIQMLTLIASALVMATTSARPLSTNEILSAIDGEYDHAASSHQRVNFDMSAADSVDTATTATLNHVLSGIDGEYTRIDTSRVNFSMDSSDVEVDDTRFVNSILSGIDGEYYQ